MDRDPMLILLVRVERSILVVERMAKKLQHLAEDLEELRDEIVLAAKIEDKYEG